MVDNGTLKAITAIISITIIEMFAIYQGINGVALAAVIGALAGLGGYAIGSKAKN